MGHSSPDITLKVYAHLWDQAHHAGKASAALDAVFAAASGSSFHPVFPSPVS
jgi:hypothetical protein